VLNILGKGQQGQAFAFFKPAVLEDGKLSGEEIAWAANGAPILKSAPAAVECRVVQVVEHGDHHTFVAEVTGVHLHQRPEGRPDMAVLEMKDLGEKGSTEAERQKRGFGALSCALPLAFGTGTGHMRPSKAAGSEPHEPYSPLP